MPDTARFSGTMLRRLCHSFLPLFFDLILVGCATVPQAPVVAPSPAIPPADREFRAVWVATVVNIDWPSAPGLPDSLQQWEAVRILDSAASIGLNAIILQVRPHCDALYQSALEPWSYYLTGTEGKPPEPFYDPLQFWIDESHRRGMELHAWFNPYRAHLARGGEINDASIVRRLPELVRLLPDSTFWLDPADPRTQDHSFAVVMDVVRRYDIDGVHFDDYFYPYLDSEFPDTLMWRAYVESGGILSRDDWRREAVNTFLERIYRGIKEIKPKVKFGVSPFGIWRPGYPSSIAGFDQYSRLYADARLWLHNGWIDYWSPQLYWPVNQIPQSFPVLLGWWTRENSKQRHLWPGLFTSRLTDERGVDEVQNEIMIERGMVPGSPGHIHFSVRALLRDSTTLRDALRNGPYRRPALVPPFPWLDNDPPLAPAIETAAGPEDSVTVSWSHPDPGDVFRWVVYAQFESGWDYAIYPGGTMSCTVPSAKNILNSRTPQAAPTVDRLIRIAVSAVDRLGNESVISTGASDGRR